MQNKLYLQHLWHNVDYHRKYLQMLKCTLFIFTTIAELYSDSKDIMNVLKKIKNSLKNPGIFFYQFPQNF